MPSRDASAGDYAMDVAALGRTLGDLRASGRRVMAVVATAGSTATGYLFHARPEATAEEFDAGESDPAPARGWDQGVRSFQCSRRADALKVWVALQRHGADGLGALYERLCALTGRLHARLAAHPAFEVLHTPQSNILCFRRTAESFLHANRSDPVALDAAHATLRARYNASGAGWITTTVLGGCCGSR